ncbi:DUF1622 domain-containing protein [Candidatus Micrarchaeota archaeon]|nr:DUF1622 domain-containing protein [Candidatus Micrarchaeota archaeon]
MIPDIAISYLDWISDIIAAFGIILITYAAFLTIYRMIRIEVLHEKRFHHYENTKRVLIQKIILSLDFFVAADLIKLAIVSNLNEIVTIAVIVAIRTVLSWSLSREVHLHKE